MSFAERRRTLLSQGGGIKADPVLENNDWETISAVAQAGKAADFWKVGDTKLIKLKSSVSNSNLQPFVNKQIYAQIIGINHNEGIEGKGIHFQLGIKGGADRAFVDSGYDNSSNTFGFRMNLTDTNVGGWRDSYMRNTVCSLFFNQLLPDDLKAVIQPCVKYTNNNATGSNANDDVTSTQDKLWLLAEFEVTGTIVNSIGKEASWQKQYDYYKNIYASGKKPIRYKLDEAGGISCVWWLRSKDFSFNTTRFFRAVSSSGTATIPVANTSYGFAPCFKV